MKNLENFFDNPTTLRDPEHFIGREAQLERIFSLLRTKQSVSLVGPRRIGKTSLLTCLQDPLIQQAFSFDGSNVLFLYLDLQKRSMKAQLDFFDEVYRTIKEYALAQGYTVAEEGDKDDELNALLEEFKQRDLYPVLLLDTFDEIVQYGPVPAKVFSFLRSYGTSGHLSYVIASVDTLGDIFRQLLPGESNKTSPFINIFGVARLTAFTPQEARLMLVHTSQKGGLPFREDEVDWVIRLAGTHPFLLQQVATQLFEEKRMHDGTANYEYIQREVQQNLFDHFEDWWIMLNASARRAMMEGIAYFEEHGELRRDHPDLCSSQLFRDYLRSTEKLVVAAPSPLPPRVDASKIKISVYKDILKHLHDPAYLGESALISIPLIRSRIEQQQASLPQVRGKIVEEVLTDAFKRMGGQEPRSDRAHGWLYYNILYYRYFMRKREMTQKMIADRLLVSERHYYRLVHEAVQQLRNEVLAMDANAMRNLSV